MDVNVRAFRVVQAAISESTENSTVDPKKTAARKGGLAGGRSRALSLTPERRREIAKKASTVRWNKKKAVR